MRVLLAGQKHFGAEVFRELRKIDGVEIAAVSAPIPTGGKQDRLAGQALLWGVPLIRAGTLNAETVPEGIDLIIAAHSFDFIGERTRLRTRYGGIGYHPSLLPVHRGRDAVRWTIRMGDRIAGGSVYRLSNRMDGGDVLAQEHVFVLPGDDAETLWRRDLSPLGVKLLVEVARAFSTGGYVHGWKQEEKAATWEPSIDRPPAYRPDLLLLPPPCFFDEDDTERDIIENMKAHAVAFGT